MLDILVGVHGVLRWPLLLLAVAGLLWAAPPLVLRRRQPDPARVDRILSGAFVGLLDLQALLGLVLFLLAGADRASHAAHAAVMLGAVVLAHALSLRVRKAGSPAPARDVALLFGLPLVALAAGLFLLPSA